jgi:hypothetical protein
MLNSTGPRFCLSSFRLGNTGQIQFLSVVAGSEMSFAINIYKLWDFLAAAFLSVAAAGMEMAS